MLTRADAILIIYSKVKKIIRYTFLYTFSLSFLRDSIEYFFLHTILKSQNFVSSSEQPRHQRRAEAEAAGCDGGQT